MKAFHVFIIGALVLIVTGVMAGALNDKGHFLIWLCDFKRIELDYFFYYITRLGEEIGYIFFAIVLWFTSWRKMITIPLLGAVVMLTSYLTKLFFQHERPSLYLEKIGWKGPVTVLDYEILSGHHSFPSGHSMAAWALFTLMAALVQKTWFSILCLVLASAVSISRVYLMVHFLQDVVAGALIGISLGYAVYYAYGRWIKETSPIHSGSYL